MIDKALISDLKTPVFITDIEKLKSNVDILNQVQERTGAKILLALKAFSQYSTFGVLSKAYDGPLYGCCASSPYEARLAREDFRGEVHSFAAAYSDEDMDELLTLCDHILFNSFTQFDQHLPKILAYNKEHNCNIEIGLRINPEHSEGDFPIYDPCADSSRLGIRLKEFELYATPERMQHISGLHFHTLCEHNSDALARTYEVVELNFAEYIQGLKWLNFGGGHHITRSDYDIELLCATIEKAKEKFNLQIYLEPGEAVALNAGFLATRVLDVVQADIPTAIMDCSASCHMPDVIEMPYTPNIVDANIHLDLTPTTEKTFRLAGKSCLAGDNIGIYDFEKPLQTGDIVIFRDMAIYSMVKTNTFNGLALPDIARLQNGLITVDKSFTYEDFKSRL